MLVDKDLHDNLVKDYLSGASNFIWAAERICTGTDPGSAEWVFKLENPVTFLLGHASELILKAGLAKRGLLGKDTRYSHNLKKLVEKSQYNGIHLDTDFCFNIEIINDNFDNHDHRYARTFSGFPNNEHTNLMEKVKENTEKARKELREYGLIVRSTPNPSSFLNACQKQLKITTEWVRSDGD